jgi:DNA-binding NarL/FixJ family response regulator
MKILIADTMALCREGLRSVLGTLADKVALVEATEYAELLRAIADNGDLTLVVVDFDLPGLDGCAGLAALKAKLPHVPIVLLAATADREGVTRAIRAGAAGLVPKSLGISVMLGAFRLVLSGGVYLPPAAISRPGGAGRGETPPVAVESEIRVPPVALTPRQREVLKLLLLGKSNKDIARQLKVAEGTVKLHVTALLKVLGVANRTEAVVKILGGQVRTRRRPRPGSGPDTPATE